MNIPTNSNPPARRRVLIIEDDFLLSRLLAQHLDELGHETVGPISLRHASSRIEHGALDTAVLQIRPSAPESIALARALRDAGVPLVVHTSERDVLPVDLPFDANIETPVSPAPLGLALDLVFRQPTRR